MHYFQIKVDMSLQQISKIQIYLTIVMELSSPFQRLLNMQTEKRPPVSIMLKPLTGGFSLPDSSLGVPVKKILALREQIQILKRVPEELLIRDNQ